MLFSGNTSLMEVILVKRNRECLTVSPGENWVQREGNDLSSAKCKSDFYFNTPLVMPGFEMG